MSEKKEKIELDATLEAVLDSAAFHAKLSNGHHIVAYVRRDQAGTRAGNFVPGDRVRVEMSPFDMSKGRLISSQQVES